MAEEPFGYSVSETARRLGVCRNTIYRAAAKGEIDLVKFQNRSIITARSLHAKLNGGRTPELVS